MLLVKMRVELSRKMTLVTLVTDPSPFLITISGLLILMDLIIANASNAFDTCCWHEQCISTVITRRRKNGCRLVFHLQPPPRLRSSLKLPSTLMLTVCLQRSICVYFKQPPDHRLLPEIWGMASGYAWGHAWGSAVVHSPSLVSGRALGKSDMIIKMQL